jgi:branched-chain amino acid transport system substrate-binding protein
MFGPTTNSKCFTLAAFLGVLLLVSVGCAQAGGDGDSAASGDTIKIGLLQPLTGTVSAAGTAVRDGAEIAADEINENGGIDGKKLELVIEDDENDPAICTNAANKVITRDQVVGIIGGWGSSCTLAIIPVVERQKVPLLVETSSSSLITDPDESGNDWTYRLSPPTAMEAAAVEGKIVSDLGFSNVFFLSVNNDWGRGSAAAFEPTIEQSGGKVVGTEYFEDDTEDFAPLLSRLESSGADSVIITTDAAQIALMLEQMQNQGLDDINVLTSGGSNFPPKVMELAGEDATEGVYFTVFFPAFFDPSTSADPDKAQRFLEEWEERGHDAIELGEAARGYDAVFTMAEALNSIDGDITHEAVAEALADVNLKGAMYGNIQFEEWNGLVNQNIPPIYIGQVSNGEVDLLFNWGD